MVRAKVLLSALVVSLLSASLASAQATSERFDFGPSVVFNSCTGEEILVAGTIHIVEHQKKKGDVQTRANFHGSGISDLGVQYQWSGNTKVDGFGADFVGVSRNRLIGQGPGNNQFIISEFSLIDGVFEFSSEIECR